ncbi:putative mRNA-capping enzyme [Pacmanvirus S19]|nr:putative mRNA-capping enzyme [Pacmanvirus S19]
MSGNFTDKMINELINKYAQETANLSAGENIELEIRFKDTTRDAFEAVYNAINDNPEFANPILECSVNVISENVYERSVGGKTDETQYIRKMTFEKGSIISDEYMQKIRLMRPIQMNDYIKYSVGLSRESKSKKFSTSNNALVRFKVRVSFDYIGSPSHPARWRFDLTAVKFGVLSEIGASLKMIKNELFTEALSPSNFIRELNFNMIDSYEIEIEYIDLPANFTVDDLHIAKKVFSLVNPQYISEIAYQEEIYHIAEHIILNLNVLHMYKNPTHRLKQLGNQAIALSKNTYVNDVFPPDQYFATDKADGKRAIISVNGNRCRILMSDGMMEFIQGEQFIPGEITIADAELIYDSQLVKPKKTDKFTLYVFDVMVYKNDNVSKSGFAVRATHLVDASKLIDALVNLEGNHAQSKNYVRLDKDNLENGLREVWENDFPYIVDGLIITEPDEPYMTTKNYKWKPYERNTIDFLAVKCPQKLLGIKPYDVIKGKDLYILFVGINHQMREKLGLGFIPQYHLLFPKNDSGYYPIQFTPSANPLAYIYYHDSKLGDIDRQIIELARDKDNTTWLFHQVRTDRKLEKNYFGNDFRIAELTFLNYIDPFNFEDLWKPSGSYFTKTAGDIYMASNKFKRFIISILLKDNLSGTKWVIDEAAGRGGDLHRYQEIGVENALFIDIDPTAIAELIRRKFAFFAVKKRHVRNWMQNGKQGGDLDGKTTKVVTAYDRVHDIEYDKLIVKDMKSLTVHTLVADLKAPASDLIAHTFQFGLNVGIVDGVVCNFALHYMCDTIEHIRNLLIFNAKMLKIGGLFIFTVMDGKAVFELLKPLSQGQQWEVRENEVIKYAIKKDYASDKLSQTGQMISVLLPFSDEMYQEPLCNVDTVISEASKLGFEVELNSSMGTMFDRFAKADRALSDRLTADDKEYISLHRYVSLRKIRDIKKLQDE